MTHLFLLRHAKAEHGHGRDYDRALTDRGLAQARAAAALVAEYPIDLVIASPARRTWQTALAIREALAERGTDLEVEADGSLYDGDVRDWLEAISAIEGTRRGVAIVGHQPAVAWTVEQLAPRTDFPFGFPPATTAHFTLPSWDVAPGDYPVPELHEFP